MKFSPFLLIGLISCDLAAEERAKCKKLSTPTTCQDCVTIGKTDVKKCFKNVCNELGWTKKGCEGGDDGGEECPTPTVCADCTAIAEKKCKKEHKKKCGNLGWHKKKGCEDGNDDGDGCTTPVACADCTTITDKKCKKKHKKTCQSLGWNKKSNTCEDDNGGGDDGGDDGGDSAGACTANADGTCGTAPAIESYLYANFEGAASPNILVDPRLCHLDHLGNNAYVGTGNGINGATADGIVIRFDVCSDLSQYSTPTDIEVGTPSGTPNCATDYTWVYTSNLGSLSAGFGWVTASPDNSYVLAAGVREIVAGTSMARWLVKLNASDGAVIWEIIMPVDNSDGMGARNGWETVEFTSDGGFVVGGWANKQSGNVPSYKSGGQVDEATPIFQKFSSTVAQSMDSIDPLVPPTPEWSFICGDGSSGNCAGTKPMVGSVKGIRVYMDNGVEKVVGAVGTSAALLILNVPDGSQSAFKDFDSVDAAGYSFMDVEPTFKDGALSGFGVTGLDSDTAAQGTMSCVAAEGCGIIRGHLSLVTADLSSQVFNAEFNDFSGGVGAYAGLQPLAQTVVITECWGLTTLLDGNGDTTSLVAACGQGIEGCSEYLVGIDQTVVTACESDPRRTWRGTALKTDLSGNILWYRNDNDRAYEFVDRGPDGQLVFLSDKPIGFGFASYSMTNA